MADDVAVGSPLRLHELELLLLVRAEQEKRRRVRRRRLPARRRGRAGPRGKSGPAAGLVWDDGERAGAKRL